MAAAKRKRRRARRPSPAPPSAAQDFAGRLRESWVVAGQRPSASGSRPVRRGSARAARERPRPLWGAFPLSEVVMLAGVVAIVVGLTRGSDGWHALVAGVVLCALAAVELAVREHFGGFRSHAALLAGLPTVGIHAGLAVPIGGPPLADILTLVADVAAFAFLVFLLREEFGRAQARARSRVRS